ncbi:MAG: glycosyltransferase, partial [Stellaceae bacterium]
EPRAEIEALLVGADARTLVWLPGFRDDTPEIYRSLDLFVLPSLREGISNTVLEAMASGRPVIATRVGGNPEIVPEGEGGLLAEPSPSSLADAILQYIDNPALLRRHGGFARAHVLSHFTLARMVANYDRVYSALI